MRRVRYMRLGRMVQVISFCGVALNLLFLVRSSIYLFFIIFVFLFCIFIFIFVVIVF